MKHMGYSMMGFGLFSGFGNILVASVMGMPGSFVFVVFFVIVGEHVLVGCGLWFCHLWCVGSQEIVHSFHILILIDVHIGDRRKMLLHDFCPCSFSPMGLDSMGMPMIDNCNNFFSLALINISENTLISLVNHDMFLLRGNFLEHRNKEISSASIHGLSKGFSSSGMENTEEIMKLSSIRIEKTEERPRIPYEAMRIHICLSS